MTPTSLSLELHDPAIWRDPRAQATTRLRAASVTHRTPVARIDAMLAARLAFGRARTSAHPAPAA